MRRAALVLAALGVLAASAAPASAAKVYRFKANVSVSQDVAWSQHFRGTAVCGDDYHQDFKGEGKGWLQGKIRGARISFRMRDGVLQSSEFRMPGTREAVNTWDVKWVGAPDENCPPNLPPATPPDTSQCGKEFRGKLDSQLLVVGGRLGLLTSFDATSDAADRSPCPDPSGVSAVGSPVVPKRRGVGDLIRNKRVRSIELEASAGLEDIPGSKLSLPGEGVDLLSGSGVYDAALNIKLTRIYR